MRRLVLFFSNVKMVEVQEVNMEPNLDSGSTVTIAGQFFLYPIFLKIFF